MTRQKVTALTIACCCFVGGFSHIAGAQTIAGSFSELSGRLKPGKPVSVTDDAGRTIKGKLTDLSATSLTVRFDGKEETLPASRVREIRERRHMTGSFAKVGLAAGVVLGLLAGATAEGCFDCSGPAATAAGGAVMVGGLGAGIGAAIGAATPRDRVVYRPGPHPPVAFSLTPPRSGQGTAIASTRRSSSAR